jgi:peroxin-3
LRRRFEQNQEDCTFTVLALLPTVTANILDAMNTEQITYEIQQIKATSKNAIKGLGGESTGPPSIADTTMTEEDGKSMVSLQSESGIHASQITSPSPFASGASETGSQADAPPAKPRKTKRQLWDDLTISGMSSPVSASCCRGYEH